jgi:hypothetical protein
LLVNILGSIGCQEKARNRMLAKKVMGRRAEIINWITGGPEREKKD